MDQSPNLPWSSNSSTIIDANNFTEAARILLCNDPEQSHFIIDACRLMKQAQTLQQMYLPDDERKLVSYAVKCNPHPDIITRLVRYGIRSFDCASLQEIELVKQADSTTYAYFNHPIKARSQIRSAISHGISSFTVQTQKECDKIVSLTEGHVELDDLEFIIRMDTDSTNSVIDLSSKFGCEFSAAAKLIQYVRHKLKSKVGVAINTGSQNTRPNTYRDAITKIARVIQASNTPELSTVNIGGGLPVKYFETDSYSLNEYLAGINEAIKKILGDRIGPNCKLIIEPGRAMVAEAVHLLIPILSVEKRRGQDCLYINDGVFTSFSDYKIHDWEYDLSVVDKQMKPRSGRPKTFKVYGRTCDSGDNLGCISLPSDVVDEDYVYVKNAGAYMSSQATSFNGFDAPQYSVFNES